MLIRFQSSGYLIVQANTEYSLDYLGVDRTTWPLDEVNGASGWLRNEQNTAEENECVLGDLHQAKDYLTNCKKEGINAVLLYCKSTAKGSIVPVPQHLPLSFCGLDYAYPSGDYYSSILNEVIAGKSALATRWKPRLNQYGLLSSLADAIAFEKERRNFAQELGVDSMVLEKGFFAVFEIYQVSLNTNTRVSTGVGSACRLNSSNWPIFKAFD